MNFARCDEGRNGYKQDLGAFSLVIIYYQTYVDCMRWAMRKEGDKWGGAQLSQSPCTPSPAMSAHKLSPSPKPTTQLIHTHRPEQLVRISFPTLFPDDMMPQPITSFKTERRGPASLNDHLQSERSLPYNLHIARTQPNQFLTFWQMIVDDKRHCMH
jgi:hypothetical protein